MTETRSVMTGPWFGIARYYMDRPPESAKIDAAMFGDDEQAAMAWAKKRARDADEVYVGRALVKIELQYTGRNLIATVPVEPERQTVVDGQGGDDDGSPSD